MRVLFCTTGGLGHLLPLRPLARALRDRGHAVAWVTAPDALPLLAGEGFDLFAAGPTFEAGRRRFRAAHADAQRFVGEQLSAYTFPRLFGAVLGPAMMAGVHGAARRWRPDFMVHEPAALAAPLVCRHLGLRNLVHGYGLRPPRAMLEDAMTFFGPLWRARGLDVPADAGLYRHGALEIAPKRLQPPIGPEGESVCRFNAHPVASAVQMALPAELWTAIREPRAGRPRIYVTFGTVFNRSPALVAAVRAAVRFGGPVIVTIGADGDPALFAGLGAKVHLHRFVEQRTLLPHCDAVVSHGGAGTVLGAAAHGVPQLVLPQAADHFRNARAIASADAGLVVTPECQGTEALGSSLSAMLEDGVLDVGALALSQEMAGMPDAAAAVRQLEHWRARDAPVPEAH
jgi:UDP:flavonoid glycosyltransferase YjiC (YdhE family)